MVENKKPWYKRWWAIVLFVIIGLIIIGSLLPNTPQTSTTTNQGEETITPDNQTSPPVEEQSVKATMGEKNALSKALSYLESMAFSRVGLINQLEYEGFTNQEAVYGVDNCGANWTEQAALKAQSYLDSMALSRQGLIEQLEYEGFTKEQAEYGVKAVGY